MQHDSKEWRAIRNRMLDHWIGDQVAINWLLDYFDVCELFDDLIDKDKEISDERVVRALWESMVDMPTNPFFRANSHILLPVISLGINYWLDANDLEKAGDDRSLHIAFVIRNVYTGITQTVIECVKGRTAMRKISHEVIDFFGIETLQEYMVKIKEGKDSIK